MKEFERSFREASRDLRVEAPRSAWKRVESRLETQRLRRRARMSRILSYAAVALLLVALSFGSLYYLSGPELADRDHYSGSIGDLVIQTTTNQSIYSIEKARSLSAVMLTHSRVNQ